MLCGRRYLDELLYWGRAQIVMTCVVITGRASEREAAILDRTAGEEAGIRHFLAMAIVGARMFATLEDRVAETHHFLAPPVARAPGRYLGTRKLRRLMVSRGAAARPRLAHSGAPPSGRGHGRAWARHGARQCAC